MNEKNNELIPVQQVIQHNKYDDEEIINDIAIIIPSRKIIFKKNIGPVCLPFKREDLDGQYVKVTGKPQKYHLDINSLPPNLVEYFEKIKFEHRYN